MFDHVTIRVADRSASERFYDTVLETLGIEQTYRTRMFSEWQDFMLTAADAEHPPTRRLHIGFVAPSRERVDEFWRAGTDAGYRSNGARAERPRYHPGYYAAYVLDPDGNNIEVVNHHRL